MFLGMEITALVHDCSQDGESGYAARCAEFPEANGQGETVAEAIADLQGAVREVIAYRREAVRQTLSGADTLKMVAA